MNIKQFQTNIKNVDICLKPYIFVVSIFICIIISIILFNNRLEDYYVTDALVKDKQIKMVVNIDDLIKITDNKKIIVEGDIFTYKVEKISDLIVENNIYKEIIIHIDNFDDKLLIDNNVIKTKIITKKTTIFNYLLKIIKGE